MSITTDELVRILVMDGLSERSAKVLAGVVAPSATVPNQLDRAVDRIGLTGSRLPTPGSSDAAKVVTVKSDHTGYELDALTDVDHGIPAGGAANTVLAKTAGTDYAAAWTQDPLFHDVTVGGALVHTGATVGFFGQAAHAQPAAIADSTDPASVITQLNLALAALRNLGLIAT